MEYFACVYRRFFPQKARRAQRKRLIPRSTLPILPVYTAGSSHKRQGEPGYMYMALFSVCKQTQTGYQLYLKTVAHSLILKFPWQKVDKGPASLVCFCMHALYLELYANACCCFLFQMFNMLKWWGWRCMRMRSWEWDWSMYEDEVLGMRL